MSLVGLLVALVIVCVVIWAARALLSAFSIGEPISTVVMVVLVVLVILYLVTALGGGSLGSLRIS